MPDFPEKTHKHDYPLIPLEKNAEGKYPFPKIRYGILPWYRNPTGEIVWGCIETNRVGPIVYTPAAGTQDIIAIKDGYHDEPQTFEIGKEVPGTGKLFRDWIFDKESGTMQYTGFYQDTIEQLISDGFNVYLQNPLTTAIREANEEHGIDLGHPTGRDLHLLTTAFESSPEKLNPPDKGVAPLSVRYPELTSCKGIQLIHTAKVDKKMTRNMNRPFYEQGCWLTLDEFRTQLIQEKERFSSYSEDPTRVQLITQALLAFELNLQLLEDVESSILAEVAQHEQNQLENMDANTPELRVIYESNQASNAPAIHSALTWICSTPGIATLSILAACITTALLMPSDSRPAPTRSIFSNIIGFWAHSKEEVTETYGVRP